MQPSRDARRDRLELAGTSRSPRWTADWDVTVFALHVFRDLVCVRITFQMTVSPHPALGASGTSSSGVDRWISPVHCYTGRWHRSSLQSAQRVAGALVVVRGSCSSRLCPRLLRRIRCGSRLQIPSITADHRSCMARCTNSMLIHVPKRLIARTEPSVGRS